MSLPRLADLAFSFIYVAAIAAAAVLTATGA
jgi:hypothetical protein